MRPVYEEISRQAIFTVKAPDVARFLGMLRPRWAHRRCRVTERLAETGSLRVDRRAVRFLADVVEEAGSPLGVEAKKIMDAGGLVRDDIIIGLVKDCLKDDDCRAGYMFDGFPRTIPQADAIKQGGVALDVVLERVPRGLEVARVGGSMAAFSSSHSPLTGMAVPVLSRLVLLLRLKKNSLVALSGRDNRSAVSEGGRPAHAGAAFGRWLDSRVARRLRSIARPAHVGRPGV